MKPFLFLFSLFLIISCDSLNKKSSAENSTAAIPKYIKRPSFELNYPSSWHVDTTDSDYDIDSYFSIDPPVNNGISIFIIYNTSIDEQEHVSAQVKAHLEKVMKNGNVSYFTNWGNFTGHGAIIKGKSMGVWKGVVKIFCHSGDSYSFLNVSQYLDQDKELVMPGFQLIESSFKLKQ